MRWISSSDGFPIYPIPIYFFSLLYFIFIHGRRTKEPQHSVGIRGQGRKTPFFSPSSLVLLYLHAVLSSVTKNKASIVLIQSPPLSFSSLFKQIPPPRFIYSNNNDKCLFIFFSPPPSLFSFVKSSPPLPPKKKKKKKRRTTSQPPIRPPHPSPPSLKYPSIYSSPPSSSSF